MDTRFVRAWQEIDRARGQGGRLDLVLAHVSTRDLIAALAGVGESDPVAANAIATELLNRERRAPYRGAFLVSLTLLVGILVTDYLLTETPLWVLSGPLATVLAAMSAILAASSLTMYLLSRGVLRSPRLGREWRF